MLSIHLWAITNEKISYITYFDGVVYKLAYKLRLYCPCGKQAVWTDNPTGRLKNRYISWSILLYDPVFLSYRTINIYLQRKCPNQDINLQIDFKIKKIQIDST